MDSHFGEFAALLTTLFWTITALSFEVVGKRIGSLNLNLLRLSVATVLLGVFSYFYRGLFLPVDATLHNWLWLILSGLIGFVIGDFLLFQAYIVIGARVSMLLMTLAPPAAALAGWLILGESMSLKSLLGMMVTIAGISLVIFNRTPGTSKSSKSARLAHPLKGILYALGAAIGQGVGLVLSKLGMESYDPFAASQIRVMAGVVGFALVFTVAGRWRALPAAVKDSKSMKWLIVGSFFGPFLGVSFSLMAVQNTNAGIAQTIMSLVPVLIIPPSLIIYKEKLRARELAGALIAVAGVSLFFL
ncbi:MAG TPA: DMT family transporter [Bacteroidales bacterium]|nr:DMT family transporter [Bacteroidales bacterium]HPT01216.1 DMT family transporter [Bacteroidales bacterium]